MIPKDIQIQEPTESQKRIMELKINLANTDYMTLKYTEGELSEEKYQIIKDQREAWREEIRKLEKENTENEE